MKRVVVLLPVFACLLSVLAIPAGSFASKRGKLTRIRVEIAENGNRFSFDSEHVDANGLPAYGSEFITEGYIYPAGTITCTNNDCDGVLPDGSPEFPDRVLGRWTCRGWHVGEGAQTTSGPWVATTQTFDFGDVPGAKTVITDGYEYSDFNVSFLRAIVGGTGPFRAASGEQVQEFLGWNPSIGTTTRMELRVMRD